MPTPYYEHAGITIYHGDCREILPQFGRFDLLLTDPPYGIDLDTRRYEHSRKNFAVQGSGYDRIANDESPIDFGVLWGRADHSVVFGANNWPNQIPFNPKKDGWICWDKRTNEAADGIIGSPFELACVIGRRLYKMIRLQHCGVVNADGPDFGRLHPSQKPAVLMQRIARLFDGESILDPFMGSGTTLVAAKNLGRNATGIEINEKYCEIAAKRLSQEVLQYA